MIQDEQKKESVFVGLSAGALYYRACVAQIHGNEISVLKNYLVSKDKTDWMHFVKMVEQDFPGKTPVTAMGFEDNCVGFCRFEVPIVNEKQMPLVVASQAEIHLPLPVEQMQYSWRILAEKENKATVAIAAAKRDMLSGVINQARQANVDAVALNSEAIVKTAAFLCDTLKKDFGLLRIYEDKVKLLFVKNGILAKVTTFDCDFSAVPDEQMPDISLLCLDIQNVIAQYVTDNGTPLPLFLDGSGEFIETVSETLLNNRGIETSRLHYDFSRISGDESQEVDVVCLGLGLIAYEADVAYNLFGELYHKIDLEKKDIPRGKKKILVTAICLLLAIFIAVSYGVDKLRLAAYEKQMDTSEFKQLLETHHLRSIIAQERIDIPDLIRKINESTPKGVAVHSLSVRRFQRVDIGGSCKEPKMMYDFAQALATCKGVEAVRVSNQDSGEKNKQTIFKLTFDYKNFTDKRKTFR